MSTLEPCLETNEMSTSNAEYLETFETVDEDKDSDEESFHLFLDDDDDEINKSSDKINCVDVIDDANKNCDEEKEKVNAPNNEEISHSPEKFSEGESNKEVVSNNVHSEDQETLTQNSSNGNIESELPLEKDSAVVENPEENDGILGNSITEENPVSKEERQIEDSDSPNEVDNIVSYSNVANEIRQMEIETPENEENNKETKLMNENSIDNQLKICSKSKSTISSESEDDILNKHADAPEECSEPIDDLDPILEESLLNENDEINSKTLTENVPSPSKNQVPMTQTPVSPHVASNSIAVQDSECVTNGNSVVIKKNSADVGQSEVNEKKMVVSNSISQKSDDNSNSSDPEDLLDISMIKDSAQDDADIAEDALQLEQENEDVENNTAGNTKTVERMESVDDSSNLENSDEDGKEGYFSETQEAFENPNEFSDSEKEKDQLEDKEESMSKLMEDIQCEDEQKCENEISEEHLQNNAVSPTFNDTDQPSTEKMATKRSLSDDVPDTEPKKPKLVKETYLNEYKSNAWDITELQSLISFSQFMTKSHLKKLTRADLEEFCIQKLCEAILHKSELGETNHQLKLQEQTIELLRKEQSVLAKQVKDLEIVNKKLMHEVKNHLGSKPIVPVKITRSVGLQVRMAAANDLNTMKRRPSQSTPQKTPVQSQVINNRIVASKVIPNSTVTRQVLSKSPQKQTTPILTQALQARQKPAVTKSAKNSPTQNNTPTRPAIKSKPTPEKRGRPSGSFIDLTDEDDKRTNAVNQNAVKTVVSQGVRINTVPKTSISSALPTVVSSTAQVMYVVQSNPQLKQGLLTTAAGQQKAVLVNFQPTNGVIGSLNTSSVSVIPKVTTSVQLKTTATLVKSNKHPAPLPNPPPLQGVNDKSLKGIPPKPVLSIRKTNTGIILQWRMPYDLGLYEGIASYQLYAYQETNAPPSTDMWRKVGDVKAMALPMACTLTQFADKNKYYFAVRPVDIHKRIGRFSNPEEISL